ncbi:uncharacterized protein [Cherax quadricarinatus]|uniref:uncharacterized protein n=1 Tax=Cherax quadricarinatus TaxID=27406 RepID=UPI00387EDB84
MNVKYDKRAKERAIWVYMVVSVFLVCSLLAYSVLTTFLLYKQADSLCTVQGRPPYYLPTDIEDIFNYISHNTAPNCSNPLMVPGSTLLQGDNTSLSGHEGTYICLDELPATPHSCRIYSFGVNREDVAFEKTMGARGCRVHVVTTSTEYSYMKITNNVYLYPLELANSSGLAQYTLDNFINLLSHMVSLTLDNFINLLSHMVSLTLDNFINLLSHMVSLTLDNFINLLSHMVSLTLDNFINFLSHMVSLTLDNFINLLSHMVSLTLDNLSASSLIW